MLNQNPNNISYGYYNIPQSHAAKALQTKPLRSFRKYDAIAAVFCLLLGFLFTHYVLFRPNGYAASAYYLLLLLSEAFYLRKSGYQIKPGQVIQAAVICLFALSFSLTDSPKLHKLSFLFLTAALAWWIFSVTHGHSFVTRYFGFHLPAAMLTHPIEELGAAPQAIANSIREPKRAAITKTICIGLAASLPLTILVGFLLSSADANIGNIFYRITDSLSVYLREYLFQFALGIPVGFWLFGSWYAASHPQKHALQSDAVCIQNLKALELFPRTGILTAITPICILYLLYLGLQANYIYSAFVGQLPQSMTYSAYARRGFFELCSISVINLAVILVLTVCSKKKPGKRHAALKGYSIFLCLCTLFMLASAFAKMAMYINAYGLTQKRLYATWFMVLLAVIFVLILLRQFMQFSTAPIIVTVSTILLAALFLIRPDALIAEYNLTRWEQGTLKSSDLNSLLVLSDDSYVVILQHREQIDEWEWETIEGSIRMRVQHLQDVPEDSWNLSSQRLIALYEEQCNAKE